MSVKHIKGAVQADRLVLNGEAPVVKTYFRLLKLEPGQSESFTLADFECVVVVQSGTAEIMAGNERFESVGQRADIWSGLADSVYCGRGRKVQIKAVSVLEVVIAGCLSNEDYAPFRVRPEEVECVDVGSNETKSRRRIFHILGQNTTGRAGNLLVSELYCDEGCWSGYPPHKHDTDSVEETAHEEVYHYRFNPPSGFGVQCWFELQDGRLEDRAFLTRDGDTIAFDTGYHPAACSPGHAGYVFTILVGKTRRSLVQNFKEEHRYLMDKIPGIGAMRDKFK